MQAVYVTYLVLHVQHLLCLSLKPFLQVLIFLGQKCRLGHTIQVVRLNLHVMGAGAQVI